jgi:hypothetical protein
MNRALPFQYAVRGPQLRRMSDGDQGLAIESRDRDLEDFLAPTRWTPVTYESGWDDAAGWQPVEYRREFGDVVRFRGTASATAPAAAGVTVFTLPAGFRPPAALRFGQVDVAADGTVQINVIVSSSDEFPVDGIQFSVK